MLPRLELEGKDFDPGWFVETLETETMIKYGQFNLLENTKKVT